MFLTEPSGAYGDWKAHAIGKKSKEVKEFLEEKYEDGLDEEASIRLAVRALLEVVESEKSMEVCVVRAKMCETLSEAKLKGIVDQFKAEKEAEEAARRARQQQQQ